MAKVAHTMKAYCTVHANAIAVNGTCDAPSSTYRWRIECFEIRKKTERKAHERKPRRMRNINVKIGSNFPFIAAAAVVAAAATSVATANNDDRFFSIFHFSFSHFHSSSFSSCSSCSSSSAQMAGFFRFALLFSARCIVTSILTLVPACKKKTMFTVGSVMGFIDCADF